MLWNWSNAFEEMTTLRREMDEMFNRTHRYLTGTNNRFPAINLYNQDDKILVVAEVPGLKREDLDIQFVDGALTLKGNRPAPQLGEEHIAALREERKTGSFEKSVRIPIEIDADNIAAQLNDGILKVELPKAAKAKARQIAIQ